jgi:hypothetical protein
MLDVMIRTLAATDEVKMIGATVLASIPIGAATLAARLGVELHRDPDLEPGLGTFDFFACEIDDTVLCTIASSELSPDRSSIVGHALADLPTIARALGVAIGDFVVASSDPPKPWLVVRQDDNGNRFVLNRCETQRQAERAADIWTGRIGTHHQAVFVVPETAKPA